MLTQLSDKSLIVRI